MHAIHRMEFLNVFNSVPTLKLRTVHIKIQNPSFSLKVRVSGSAARDRSGQRSAGPAVAGPQHASERANLLLLPAPLSDRMGGPKARAGGPSATCPRPLGPNPPKFFWGHETRGQLKSLIASLRPCDGICKAGWGPGLGCVCLLSSVGASLPRPFTLIALPIVRQRGSY